MNREDYAKIINWRGTASREIQLDTVPAYEVGSIIKPGLCWSDGGEFAVETYNEYPVLFEIIEEVDGHAIDYENEQECFDLGCEGCDYEKEILINRSFEIVDFWEWDEETGFAKVFLKPV